jgi:hypothetical protein
MPSLLIHEGAYYSPLDEASFFRWLGSVSGVHKITGTPNGLHVSLRTANLSERALRDLIALHWRYSLPMRDLRAFKNTKNESWFFDTGAYWYESIFGLGAISANMELRLAALKQEGKSPVQAIKTIRAEYAVSLGEAKRRLSLSSSWAKVAASSTDLQDRAISIAARKTKPKKRNAA